MCGQRFYLRLCLSGKDCWENFTFLSKGSASNRLVIKTLISFYLLSRAAGIEQQHLGPGAMSWQRQEEEEEEDEEEAQQR